MARIPLYKKAETEMLRRIKSGQWPVGLRLGNEFQLADEFGVSQGTMRRALVTLEQMGHLRRTPGRGTTVARPRGAMHKPEPAVGFDRLITPEGGAPVFSIFRARARLRPAGPEETAIFGPGELLEAERTLNLGSDRAALDLITVPASVLGEIDSEAAEDFPDFLDAHGITPERIEDRVSAEITTMGDSVALAVDRITPLLVLTRLARDATGRPLARQVLRVLAEAVSYEVRLVA